MLTNAGNSFETRGWRPERHMEDLITAQARRRRRFDRETGLYRDRQTEKDVQQRAERPDHLFKERDVLKAKNAEKDRPRECDSVPFMSPMPLPVIEEPVSDCGLVVSKESIILGMPEGLEANANVRPKESSSVPAQHLHVQSPATSPLSAVSSLHGEK
jgi:hypothetical protein